MIKVGPYTVKSIEPMTDDELIRQVEFVSGLAESAEFATEQDEVEGL